MLRLALIESVRRMALRTVQRLDELESADEWAARLTDAARRRRRAPWRPRSTTFIAYPPLAHADLRLPVPQPAPGRPAAAGRRSSGWSTGSRRTALSAEEAAARATERLALTQVMMANSITSLRGIARLDWEAFVERQSAHRGGPARRIPPGVYAPDDVRDARPVPARGRAHRAAHATTTRRRWRGDAVELAAPRRPTGRPRPTGARPRRLLPRGRRAGRARADYRRTGRRPGDGYHRWALRHPNVRVRRWRARGHGGGARGRALARRAGGARRAWPLVLLLALHPGQRHRRERA